MTCALRKRITWLLCPVVVILWSHSAWAVVVSIPELKATPGESVVIPILIDQVDNLAGAKVVMEYDPKLLSFEKGARTDHTDSFMHVINDKNPGRLIIVMAGAKGIKGKDFPILTLTFKIKTGLTEEVNTQLAITEVQLMTDQLKDIKCETKTYPLKISPHSEKPLIRQEVFQGK
jgi:hypothetical protein